MYRIRIKERGGWTRCSPVVPWSLGHSVILQSKNHEGGEVERDHWSSSGLLVPAQTNHLDPVVQDCVHTDFMFKDGDSKAPWALPVQGLGQKWICPNIQDERPMFQCVPIASCHWAMLWWVAKIGTGLCHMRRSWETWDYLAISRHIVGCSPFCPCLLKGKIQNRTQQSSCSFNSDQSREEGSPL